MIPDYYDLIMRWFQRSQQEEEMFTKFIFLYISFNAFINQTREELRERQKIEFLKHDQEAKFFYLQLIQREQNLKKIIDELKLFLDIEPIQNSTDGRNYWVGSNGRLRSENDWENLVEYWYRVRNNLFHGHKVPQFDRDETLVRLAFLTLSPLMKNFVDHYLTWGFD